jgi:hypothetical protein
MNCFFFSFQVWSVTDFSSAGVSMFHMVLLAYDRYQAIVYPLKYSTPNKSRWIAIQIASSYMIALTLWLPPVLLFMTTGPYDADCYFAAHIPELFLCYGIIVEVIPLLALTFMYASCVQTLRNQFRKLHPVAVRIVRSIDDTDQVAPPAVGFIGRMSIRFRQHVPSSHVQSPASITSGSLMMLDSGTIL